MEAGSSKPKSNLRFTAVSIVMSFLGVITPFTWLILVGILLAGFAVYRSHRSKGAWFALVLGIVVFAGMQYFLRHLPAT